MSRRTTDPQKLIERLKTQLADEVMAKHAYAAMLDEAMAELARVSEQPDGDGAGDDTGDAEKS